MKRGSRTISRGRLAAVGALLLATVVLEVSGTAIAVFAGSGTLSLLAKTGAFLAFSSATLLALAPLRRLRIYRRVLLAGALMLPLSGLLQQVLLHLYPTAADRATLTPRLTYLGLEVAVMVGFVMILGVVLAALLKAEETQCALEQQVDQRAEAEAKLRRQAEDLERVAARAEAGSRAKSEFVANMSHEIRTPFNGVLGMTELALDLADKPEQREYLEAARESAESLLLLIEDVLDLSKIEAGRMELEQRDFSLQDHLEATLRTVLPQALDKGLELRFEAKTDLPPRLVSDPLRLRQVLMNLLGNAVKFTAKGEVVLEASVLPEAPFPDAEAEFGADEGEGDVVWLRLAVKDTGIGIPEEKQRHIFQPFSQADASTTRRFGGTGLGLTISSRIVELLGGRLKVESAPGEGSCFFFAIPCRSSTPKEGDGVSETTSVTGDASEIGSLRIVVAEDHPVNRKVVTRMLEKAGHRVIEAENGQQALDLLDDSIDVVLMDVRMPVMDGLAATRALRALEHGTRRHVPVLALTASAFSEDRERCLAAGMDGYVSKPVTREELLTALARAVESVASRLAATTSH